VRLRLFQTVRVTSVPVQAFPRSAPSAVPWAYLWHPGTVTPWADTVLAGMPSPRRVRGSRPLPLRYLRACPMTRHPLPSGRADATSIPGPFGPREALTYRDRGANGFLT